LTGQISGALVWVFGFVTVFLLVLLFKPSKDIVAPKDILKGKVEELGPMTSKEKIVLGIMVIVLTFGLQILSPYCNRMGGNGSSLCLRDSQAGNIQKF
jgi:di/tricarboxylate transporter